MRVIFHHAASLAKKRANIDWAEVAIRAIELEARNGSGIEREEALLYAMRVRSWFIGKMGSRPGHVVLDKEIVLHWVIDGLKLTMRATKERATLIRQNLVGVTNASDPKVKHQLAKDLSGLRWIKHRLRIAQVLADCGELPSDSVLHDWLPLQEQLP
jgi:hypothetical protein